MPGEVEASGDPPQDIFFTVLHTNDEHGSLIPHSPAVDYLTEAPGDTAGGFARVATAVQSIREEKQAQNEPVLLFSAGDFIAGSPYSWLIPGGFAPELTVMQLIGYNSVAIGNHEFDYGTEVLTRYLQASGYPEAHEQTYVLAGNMEVPPEHPLVEEGLYRETCLLELDNGLTLGLFALLGDDALSVTQDHEPVRFTGGEETIEKARHIVSALKDRGADVIVALTHSGLEEDRVLAREVPGLHVIIGGHCHTALFEPVEENGVIIAQTGSRLKHLGCLELVYNPAAGSVRLRNQETGKPYLLPIDDRYPPDPYIDEVIQGYTLELNSLVSRLTGGRIQDILEPVVFSDFELPNTPPLQETPFGNFVTDAMRIITSEKTGRKVDIAIQANGSIRGGVIPGSQAHSRGHVSFYDLAELVGLGVGPDGYAGYPIVSFYLTGEEVRRVLEVAVLLRENLGDTYFLQFSGVSFDFDPRNALLFTVPILDTPVPSAMLPGSAGAVSRAVLYTGEDRQGTGDEGFRPIKYGDENLYHLVTDLYILSFLPMVGEMVPGLALELKDSDGNPVPDDELEELIVKVNGSELKVWQTVMEYAAAQPLNVKGFPQMDNYYASTQARINTVENFPLVVWPILALVFFITLLIILIRRISASRRRRVRRPRRFYR